MPSRLALLVALLFVLWPQVGETSQLVVIESTTTQLNPGQVIDGSESLSLAAGVQVTLVGEDGTLTKLKGPFSGAPAGGKAAEGDKKVVAALSRLFASSAPGTSSLGAFRGYGSTTGGAGLNPPDVWAVNVYRSESLCIPEGITPMLWRPDPGRVLSLIVLHLSTGTEDSVGFPASVQDTSWPKQVPLLDGREYSLRDGGNMWERKLVLKTIPKDLPTEAHGIAWMADSGCLRQAKAQVAKLASR